MGSPRVSSAINILLSIIQYHFKNGEALVRHKTYLSKIVGVFMNINIRAVRKESPSAQTLIKWHRLLHSPSVEEIAAREQRVHDQRYGLVLYQSQKTENKKETEKSVSEIFAELKKSILEEITCPITRMIFKVPVLLITPNSKTIGVKAVEEDVAKELILNRKPCPFSSLPIDGYVIDLGIKGMVDAYIKLFPRETCEQYIPKKSTGASNTAQSVLPPPLQNIPINRDNIILQGLETLFRVLYRLIQKLVFSFGLIQLARNGFDYWKDGYPKQLECNAHKNITETAVYLECKTTPRFSDMGFVLSCLKISCDEEFKVKTKRGRKGAVIPLHYEFNFSLDNQSNCSLTLFNRCASRLYSEDKRIGFEDVEKILSERVYN